MAKKPVPTAWYKDPDIKLWYKGELRELRKQARAKFEKKYGKKTKSKK